MATASGICTTCQRSPCLAIIAGRPVTEWVRKRRAPNLKPRHIHARFAWAGSQLERGASVWRRTVYSHEKRFSLDGPDGLASYWHDVNRQRLWQCRRQQGGVGFIVWGCFSFKGKGNLNKVANKVNAERYISVPEESLLPFMEEYHPNGSFFQQDGASSQVLTIFETAEGSLHFDNNGHLALI